MSIKKNTLYTNDNLAIMNGMNSESVDLIYIDPPFNSKRFYNAPIESKAAGAAFNDIWTWQDVDSACLERLYATYPYLVQYIDSIHNIHSKAMASYLAFMAQRIIEMHRVLKVTGSFYLHCDPNASHYLKVICDRIFGKGNFRNEIIWCYSIGGRSRKEFGKKHDVIMRYTKSNKYIFNWKDVSLPMTPHKQDKKAKSFGGRMGISEDGREYVEKQGSRNSDGTYKYYRYYLDEGKIPEDWWTDINAIQPSSKERTGYPTQKPLSLLHRVIKASSNKGDIVLDAFCGCATTCVAAQQLNRKWIGIDIEGKARDLVMERLKSDTGLFTDFVHTQKPPVRDDIKPVKLDKAKEKLYKKQEGICNGCGGNYQGKDFEIDHILPRSKGGQDNIENLQLLCDNCNRTKKANTMEYLRIKVNRLLEAA